MGDINKVIESIRREQLVLFVGSGFSKDAGAPMAWKIADGLLQDLPKDDQEQLANCSLPEVSDIYQKEFDRERLLDRVEGLMQFETNDNYVHQALTRIPHIHSIITTNYDTLIEDALGKDCYVVRRSSDCVNLPTNKTIVYKIHGDFQARDRIVLTKHDYDDCAYRNNDKTLWGHVLSLMLTRDVLFVGYSISDGNIENILQVIKEDTHEKSPNMYLLAPDWKPRDIRSIEDLCVKYINGRADTFLKQVEVALEKNVQKDFRKKKITYDTYCRYCNLHDINPTVTTNPATGENSITSLKCINGHQESKLHFTAIGDKARALLNHDFNAFTNVLPKGLNQPSWLPSLILDRTELKDYGFEINGMTISDMDDISQIMIVPIVQNKQVGVRIPSLGFYEKVVYSVYGANRVAHCVLDSESYVLKLDLHFDYEIINVTCNVEFKDKYEDNSLALRWIDLLIGLYEGEEIYLTGVDKPIVCPKQVDDIVSFRRIKQYYQNVADIEHQYNILFESYECYSDQRFIDSCYILGYKTHDWVESIANREEQVFEMCGDYNELRGQLELNHHYAFYYSQEVLNSAIFNGHEFFAKYRYTFTDDNIVTSFDSIGEGKVRIKLVNQGRQYHLLSDNQLEELVDVSHSTKLLNM